MICNAKFVKCFRKELESIDGYDGDIDIKRVNVL